MAYLHKRTFEILGRERRGYVSMEDLFYADDALAETIQVLNTRGYATEACRAGELYDTTRQITLYNVRDSGGRLVREADVIAAYLERFPKTAVLRAWECGPGSWHMTVTVPPKEAYIRFRENARFKRLPKDTVYLNRTLMRAVKGEAPGTERCVALADYYKELLEWACRLPLNMGGI